VKIKVGFVSSTWSSFLMALLMFFSYHSFIVVLNIYDSEWTIENDTNSLPPGILINKLMHIGDKKENTLWGDLTK
jgi:hypothetical protein